MSHVSSSPTRLAAVLLPALLVFSACATSGGSAPAPAPMVGSEWQLVDLGGRAVLAGVPPTLAFPEAGRVAGSSSCNRFFGSYTLMQDRVAIGQLGSTRMACAAAVNEQETRYLDALQKAQRLEVQGKTLLVHAEGLDKPLRFTRTKP